MVTTTPRVASEDLAAAIEPVVRARIPGAENAKVINFRGSDGGFSTETFLFEVDGIEVTDSPLPLVLRREHADGLFPDYDLLRQTRVIKALEPTDVAVPTIRWLDRDSDAIGSPYLVMDAVVGGSTTTDIPSYHETGIYFEASEQQRSTMWDDFISTIATVHQLDWRGLGLGWMTSAGDNPIEPFVDYVERTLTWAHPAHSPVLDEAVAYLKRDLYVPEHISLCWGDARLSNILFRPDLSVAAVLDWETAYIGDHEADLAWMFFLDWASSTQQGIVPLPGTPTREEVIERYERATGWTVENLRYNEVLAATFLAIPLLRMAHRFGMENPNDLVTFCDTRIQELLG
jgi:aminoglycoside phosphotransferase (APT) family kinase protein